MKNIDKPETFYFIMNPGSKDGKSKKLFKRIFALLDEKNILYDYALTEDLSHAALLSKNANEQGYSSIIAVGGDGTINRVLNGFFNPQGKRISNAKLGVIYTGTSPDFCKSYNIPLKLTDAIETLVKGKSISAFIGRIEFEGSKIYHEEQFLNSDAYHLTEYFACCANIGLGAELARRANSGIRKYMGDFLGTFISLLRTLYSFKANDFLVKTDGKEEVLEKVLNISVGRTHYIASGIQIKNKISLNKPLFYRLLAANVSFKKVPALLKKIYRSHEFKNDNILSLDYIDNIEIAYNAQNPEVEMDGDPVGYLPCKISSTTDMLEIITNPEGDLMQNFFRKVVD